uniref:RxLR effector protein n=1 Tax=Peronospora matthiolae TaxID=2874970 RepID=A0AAV1U6K7_9STRA
MTKFFLRIILALVLMNGCSSLSAPFDKKMMKLTTPSHDHVTPSELVTKRMLRVTSVIDVVAGDGQEVAKLEPEIEKAFSRSKTKFQEWKPAQRVKKLGPRVKKAFGRLKTNYREWEPGQQVKKLGSRIKKAFGRLKTDYQEWNPVQQFKMIKKTTKIAAKLIKWYVIVQMKIEAFIKWIRELFGLKT